MLSSLDTTPVISRFPLHICPKTQKITTSPHHGPISSDCSNAEYTYEYLTHSPQLTDLTLLMNSLLEMRYSPYVYDYILKTDASAFSYIIRDKSGEVVAGMGCRLERATSTVLPRRHASNGNAEEKSNIVTSNLPQSLDLCCMMLCVASEHRRKGLAQWMINHALYNAKEFRGTDGEYISNFYLHVQTSNDAGKAFYENVGFMLVQTIENYYKRLNPSSCYVLTMVVHDEETYMRQEKGRMVNEEVL